MSTDAGKDFAARLRAVIARTFGLDAGRLSGSLRMGNPPQWDSIAHMNLVVALEREFGVTFPTYEIAELASEEKILGALGRQGAT